MPDGKRVGYVQVPQAVAYIVLTSRDKASYQKDSGQLEKVLKTLVYLEPKPERREVARNTLVVTDSCWMSMRKRKSNRFSPNGGKRRRGCCRRGSRVRIITSTNARRAPPKKPDPGDITLTDKKGKLTGSISFEQVGGNERAVDLLEQYVTEPRQAPQKKANCSLALEYLESSFYNLNVPNFAWRSAGRPLGARCTDRAARHGRGGRPRPGPRSASARRFRRIRPTS